MGNTKIDLSGPNEVRSVYADREVENILRAEGSPHLLPYLRQGVSRIFSIPVLNVHLGYLASLFKEWISMALEIPEVIAAGRMVERHLTGILGCWEVQALVKCLNRSL